MKVIDLVNFEREAEKIVSDAKARAEEIVNSAMAEAERHRKTGYDEGLRKAKEEMEKELSAREKQMADRIRNELSEANNALMSSFCDQLKRAVAGELSAVSSKVVEMAISVAGSILRKEVTVAPAVVNNVILDALNYVAVSGRYVIKVNEKSAPAVEEMVSNLKTQVLFSKSRFDVVRDDSIEPGGCKIEADGSTVDATLAEQLKRVEGFLK